MSILAALSTLREIEQATRITDGVATLYNDCQKGVRQTFKTGPIGVKDATQDEYDIILEILHMQQELCTTIEAVWIEGHPAPDTSGQQVWNAVAHSMAVPCLRDMNNQDPKYTFTFRTSVVDIQ